MKRAAVLLYAIVVSATPNVLAADVAWNRHAIDDSSKGADGVRLADVNGDGLLDIATGWEQSGIVRVYLNPGPEHSKSSWPAIDVGAVADIEDAVFVDLDQDGAIDVVSSSEGETRTISFHWAPQEKDRYSDSTAWSTQSVPSTAGQRWMYAIPFDVDGQRELDVVIGSKNDGTVSWLESPENPRDVTAWKLHKIVDAGWIMSLQAVDIDGDRQDDIVVSDRSGPHQGVYWLNRRTPGEFELQHIGAGDVTPKFLDARRTDAGPEIAVTTNEAGILLFQGGPGRWEQIRIPGAFNKSAAFGDLNHDGRWDLAYTSVKGESPKNPDAFVGWIEGDGFLHEKPPVVHRISDPAGSKFDRIELLDLDGDGDLDLVTCEERADRQDTARKGLGVIWYENPHRDPKTASRPARN
jgi:hypothetical protein